MNAPAPHRRYTKKATQAFNRRVDKWANPDELRGHLMLEEPKILELLRQGANPHRPSPLMRTIEDPMPETLAEALVRYAQPSNGLLDALVEAGVDPTQWRADSPIVPRRVIDNGRCFRVMAWLLRHGAQVTDVETMAGWMANRARWPESREAWSALTERLQVDPSLFVRTGVDRLMLHTLSFVDYAQREPLRREDCRDWVQRCLDLGAELDAVNLGGRTPVFKHIEHADVFVELGCQVNVADARGLTPLHEAARKGFLSSVKTLLAAGADPNVPNQDGETPLLAAVHEHGQSAGTPEDHVRQIVQALLEAGADPHRWTHAGQSVLERALTFRQVPVVEALLEGGALGAVINGQAQTAFQVLCDPSQTRLSRDEALAMTLMLLKAGADPDAAPNGHPSGWACLVAQPVGRRPSIEAIEAHRAAQSLADSMGLSASAKTRPRF